MVGGNRSQETGDRSQESGVRRQESGVRSQESGDKRQERWGLEIGYCKLYIGEVGNGCVKWLEVQESGVRNQESGGLEALREMVKTGGFCAGGR